ncbi:conserved Plasmodium protein, unknown function [Plasmodium berghei]|uniref:tRNA(Ile)-lysidine/2-thiocytidine synthase N-terminal domain-containing protein n=1 Tax=Plasmodium berghei TaxID=5821 RepID=A0A113R7H2_PLABE|nr:conserved Plasmodium protein, unknown function [Plasmodium berghei]SCM19758.1 conserved Plasmodium protein, unknown function [Plasmodium berghei]SCN23494.1 conserved Plasmodium protein, unknown function [Plasmodium berghei]SCO59113.1 conserved Plasmodium protein, unknown function [Plasmodium berghei]
MHLIQILSILWIYWNYIRSLKIQKDGYKHIHTFLNPWISKKKIKIKNPKHDVYLKTEKNIYEIIFNKDEKLSKDILNKKKKKKKIILNGYNKEQNKVNNIFKEWKTHNEIFLKKFCSFINIENDIKNKELQNVTKYNSLLFTKWENPKNTFNMYSNTYKDQEIKEKNNLIDEIIQQVEIYWISILKNRYFFYFLKKKKYIIFSVSAGVDSLALLYSFIFTIYKIIIIILYKDNLNYLDILDKIKNIYFYKHENIYNLIQEKIAKLNHICNNNSECFWINKIYFFLGILNKITVLYCDHKTRIECTQEKKFLKHICKLYNLKFATKILTKNNIMKTKDRNIFDNNNFKKSKSQNNFLLISRLWRQNSYIELTNKILKQEIKELINEKKKHSICDFKKGTNYKYSEYLNDINIYLKKLYKKNVCNILLKNYKKFPKYFSDFFFKKTEFLKNSKKIKSIIFLGHHQNDNNETMLFHFFRGIYIKNLKGINFLTYFKNCLLYRPFIKLNKIQIYNYMYAIKKKWKYDISNQKLYISRNFIRNILIPNISLIFEKNKKIKKDNENITKTTIHTKFEKNEELENAKIYAYSSLNKRLTNLSSQIKNLDKHLEFHNNIFYIYLKNKYYISDNIKIKTNNFFIIEYMKMQNNLYKHFFFNTNVNNIIKINKLLYKNNIFLKIFNFYEFLILSSKLARIEALYNIIKSYVKTNLNYSIIDQIYNELFLFAINNLRDQHLQKHITYKNINLSNKIENDINIILNNKTNTRPNVEISKRTDFETSPTNIFYKKLKMININGKSKIVVNNNLFCIINNHTDDVSNPNSIQRYKDKSSNVFIHDNISAKVKRINKKSFDIQKTKTKNAYLFIKKRKKKKKEKFNIHIRYLKKNDLIINDNQKNKYMKATKFLLKHHIPYIYKYFLPIVEITNFKKSGILFFFLFGKLANDKFALRYSIKKKKLQNNFIYSIKFKNNDDSFI